MAAKNAYPMVLKRRVHQLYYVEDMNMTEAMAILKKEFPRLANRMNGDRLHSVSRMYRKGLGLPPKNPNRGTGSRKASPGKAAEVRSTRTKAKRKEVIEAARKLRLKNYRWQAIVEELMVQFPGEKIPPAGALSNILRGKKAKTNNQYHIAITSQNGTVLNMDVSSSKSLETIIKHILEV